LAIQYRYGFSQDGKLVDVSQLLPSTRRHGAPFSCVGCGGELIPYLGERKHSYFGHKPDHTCNSETYLHGLAKRVFAETYEAALREGAPFWLVRTVPSICDHYEDEFGFTCARSETERHDLTKYFDQISVEEGIDGFRADVLLLSGSRRGAILVEFAVSHRCEPEKIQSKHRIIEIQIDTEADIDRFNQRIINTDAPGVGIYNFSQKTVRRSYCNGGCNRQLGVFLVYHSQRCKLLLLTPEELSKSGIHQDVAHAECVGVVRSSEQERRLFKESARSAHLRGIPIRNCFICKHHGAGDYTRPVFCLKKRELCNSATALTCSDYSPFANLSECRKADDRNEAFAKRADGRG
jgi:hypothetical protein